VIVDALADGLDVGQFQFGRSSDDLADDGVVAIAAVLEACWIARRLLELGSVGLAGPRRDDLTFLGQAFAFGPLSGLRRKTFRLLGSDGRARPVRRDR